MNGSTAGTNSNTYSISQTTLAQTGAQIYVTVTNTAGHVTSQTVTLTVNTAQTSTVNVLTYHNDVARTGQNLNESTLTTANVKSANFGLVGNLSVDAGVDAEPLYVSNLLLSAACTTSFTWSPRTIPFTRLMRILSRSCGTSLSWARTKPRATIADAGRFRRSSGLLRRR